MSDTEVENLRGEVATLSGVVADLSGMVRDLSTDILRLSVRDNPSSVRSWIDTDDTELGRLILAGLEEWLATVWVRYPGPALPECWAYHPAVIEELWVLMNQYKSCFRKGGTWKDFGDWLSKYRPGAAARIQKEAGTCTLSLHEPGEQLDPVSWPKVPEVDLTEVADHWTGHRCAPYPPGSIQ